MKHNWTYKELGDIADVVMGQSPDGSSLNDSKGIEFHQGKVAFGEKFLKPSHCYTTAPTKLAKGHSLLLCVRAPVGILNITDREICIGRGLCAVNAKDDAINEFLYYALRSKQEYFEKNSTGSTFKAISSALVKGALIPCPSLDEQQAVVRELDGINHLIDLQEEQLREYDRLAQSLFYSTFGDPATNPKGWEVKKLGEVAEQLFAGGDVPKNDLSQERDENHPYPIYSNGVVQEGLYGYTGSARVSEPALTISARGTIGVVFKRNEPFFPVVRLLVLVPKNEVLGMDYTMYCLRTFNIENNGVAIPQLTVPMLKQYAIPLPPLDLQQSFAAQIEAIEQQKALICKSLDDTRTLLAARMQYYFE